MTDTNLSRRGALIGTGLLAAWLSSPARALMAEAKKLPIPPFVDALIARMTLEEKAGQLTLRAAKWGGDAAAALNPATDNSGFGAQLADAVAGKLTGVFNGGGAVMASRMQHAVMAHSRLKIPLMFGADVIYGYRTIFPVPLAEAASFAFDLGAFGNRQGGRVLVIECLDVDFGTAVGRIDADIPEEAEPVRAEQDDIEPPVLQFLDSDDLADAADRVERCSVVVVEPVRLDHPDPSAPVDRVAHHLAVARLEDVQRKLRAREQNRAGQRKQGHADDAAHVKSTEDRRRRCAADHGSSRPCASSSWRKRLRAAPSFHSRSRRTISSRASAAASRSDAPRSIPNVRSASQRRAIQ